MMNHLAHILTCLYILLVRLYPRSFRAEFEDEMQAVFEEMVEQETKKGIFALASVCLRELLDAPLTLLRVHWFSWRKKEKATSDSTVGFPPVPISGLPPPSPDGRASWMQAGLEVSLFLSTGIILVLLSYLPLTWPVSGPPRSLGSIDAVSLLLFIPLFLVGLTRGLPRWAYPFGGILLGYGFLTAIRFDMLPFLVASLLAFVLLAIAAAVVNARVRPLPPLLRRMGQSIGLDWTRLSFCIYGIMPLMITTAFDDARCNNQTPYLAISVLLMVAGAFAHIRSRRTVLQMTALLGGMSLSFWCALLDRAYFMGGLGSWISSPGPWLAGIGWTLKLWASMTALILAPFLIGLAHRALTPRRAA
ncbi:MAG: hypothetical protein E3J25_02695 [Anaerolineales bacterium]|nr:MAG: hypothetical protein E3J25_02695 [Anaerolineales bacterium]